MKKNVIDMKPEEFAALHVEEEKQDTIEFKQLEENSLKNIDEIHKLFPHWKRERILKKLKLTHEGKDLRFIAKIDGTIVAHVKIKLGTSIHNHVCSITSLIVTPTHRRKGLGAGLMEYTISKLPKKNKNFNFSS